MPGVGGGSGSINHGRRKQKKKDRERERERERGLAWNDDKNLLRTGDYDQLNSQPPEVQLNK